MGTVTASAVAMMAAGAILLAGCGGTSAGQKAASGGSARYDKAVKYAECMRSHGEPNWPDPASDGTFTALGQAGITTGSVMGAAMKACVSLNPFPTLSKAQRDKAVAAMLKYSECMRSHGVTNYPDPNSFGGVPADPPGVDINSPQYRAAVSACEHA
jgi:hypothetical protein